MTAARRWCLVGLGVVLLVATPFLARAVPVGDAEVGAGSLLTAIRDSRDTPYSGYAVSVGAVRLPTTDRFAGLASLFGDRTRLRVWWRNTNDWRVSTLRTTGGTTLYRDDRGTTRWEYESARATRTPAAPVRLPTVYDVVPPVLARHLLAGADRDEVHRLPAERIAGRSAPGLRLDPASPQSTIDHVDVWADPATGVPLRIRLYGVGDDAPALSTSFEQFSTTEPAPGTTAFDPPPGADLRFDETPDVAVAAYRYAPFDPPAELAGLPRRDEPRGAVGVYGRGATTVLAVPLRDRVAEALEEQLSSAPRARETATGPALAAGPLRLRLASPDDDRSWLLVGTVTDQALARGAQQLAGRASRP